MCVYVCVCMYDVSRVAIDSKHVRVSHLETQNVLFFGTNLLDRFTSVACYQKKKKKKKIRSSLVEERSFTFLCSPRPPRRPLATCKHQESAGRDPRVSK